MAILNEIYSRCVSISGNIYFFMGLLGIILSIAGNILIRKRADKRSVTLRDSARRIAVVTGASRGLGCGYVRAIARQMDAFDIQELWIIARNRDKLVALARETGVPCLPIPVDLTSGRSIEVIREMLSTRDYDVRLLINCAGVGNSGTSEQIGNRGEQMEIVLNDSVTVAMVQTLLPFMRGGSRIVNIASIAAFQSIPGFNVYAASKAFVLSYSRGLRSELASRGISVTAVCPYWIRDTGFIEHATGEKAAPFLSKTTDQVVRTSLRAIKGRRRISTPSIASFLDLIIGPLLPDIVLSRIAAAFNLKRKK